jgi:hypothetical protein
MDLSRHSLKKVPKRYGDWVISMAKDLVHFNNIRIFNSRLLNPATGTIYCFSDRKGKGASYLFGQSASKGEHKVLRRIDKITSDGHILQLIEVFTSTVGAMHFGGKNRPLHGGLQAISGLMWSLMGLPEAVMRRLQSCAAPNC